MIVSPHKSEADKAKASAATQAEQHHEEQPQQFDEVLELEGEQQQPQEGFKCSASAAVGWQFPLNLDGSIELTEEQLLEHLPEFNSANAMTCEVCRTSLQQAAAGHQEVKQQLDAQRAAFGKVLNNNVQEMLDPGVNYYLVPK